MIHTAAAAAAARLEKQSSAAPPARTPVPRGGGPWPGGKQGRRRPPLRRDLAWSKNASRSPSILTEMGHDQRRGRWGGKRGGGGRRRRRRRRKSNHLPRFPVKSIQDSRPPPRPPLLSQKLPSNQDLLQKRGVGPNPPRRVALTSSSGGSETVNHNSRRRSISCQTARWRRMDVEQALLHLAPSASQPLLCGSPTTVAYYY